MIKKLVSLILVSLLLLVPVVGIAFDQKPGAFKEFQKPDGWGEDPYYVDLEDGFFDVNIFGTAEGLCPVYEDVTYVFIGWQRAVGVFGQEGSGFHIGNGYIVTAAHVVKPAYVQIQESKSIFYIVPVDRVVSAIITVGNGGLGHAPAELIWVHEEYDLALLRVIGNWLILKDYGYKLTHTLEIYYGLSYDHIKVGDVVAVIARARSDDGSKLWHYEVRYGKVVDSGVKLPREVGPEVLPWFNLLDFTMDLKIYPGDSGSPIFAFREGKPVIIGVARALAGNCWYGEEGAVECEFFSYASRVDPLERKTQEIGFYQDK